MKKIRIRNLLMACFLCACMITPTNIVYAQEEAGEENKMEDGSTPSMYAYDFDAPVVEKIEFPQCNQVVKAGTTITVYIDAYDAGSGIKEITGGISVGNSKEDAMNHPVINFVKDGDGNRYKGEIVIPSGYTYGYLSGITVTDKNGNFTNPVLNENNVPIYPFTIQNESTKIYDIESINFPQNEQTVTHNMSTSMQIKLTSNSNKDLRNLNAHFTNKENGNNIQLRMSKDENGVFVTENAILTCAAGFYTLTEINGYSTDNAFVQLKLPEKRYSFTMDSVNDGSGPIIKSIKMDKQGQTLSVNDKINFEIEVVDMTNVNKTGASIQLSPAVALSYNYGSLPLTFDEASQTFKGIYTIPEAMYPCEWYVSSVYLTDNYENQADTSKLLTNNAYYFNVTKDGDFTSPTYEVSLSFRKLNNKGEFEYVNEFKKNDIERRTTWKDAGLPLPDGSTTYKGLKFEGWKIFNQEVITEDYEIIDNIYETAYASYDKIPLSVSYSYVDKEMRNKTVQRVIIAEKGMTYAQALALDDSVPSDVYEDGVKFEGWKFSPSQNISMDSVVQEGFHSFINLEASYDKILMMLTYNYVDKDLNFRSDYHVVAADKGMTYAQAFALDKEKPSDLYSGIECKGWKMASDKDFNVDDVIDVNESQDYFFQASYDKNFARISYQYIDEKMQSKRESHVVILDKDTTYKQLLSSDKDIPKDVSKEAGFKEWKFYSDDEIAMDTTVRNYDYITYQAIYEKAPVTVNYTYSGTGFYNHTLTKTSFVKQGTTYKEALKDMQSERPANMTKETPFKQWQIDRSIDENEVIPNEGININVKSVFEQIPLRVEYSFYGKDGKRNLVSTKVLMDYGSTYGDILKKDTGIPKDLYEGIVFQGWEASDYGTALPIDKVIDNDRYVVNMTAKYEGVPVILDYQYLDKNKQAKTVSNVVVVDEDTTISQLLALDKNVPTDSWEGYTFTGWNIIGNNHVIGLYNNTFSVYPTYEDKKTVYTIQDFYNEQGYHYAIADMMFVDEGETYGDAKAKLLASEAPVSFKGLEFKNWEYVGNATDEQPIDDWATISVSARYKNSIVRIHIDDMYESGWGGEFGWQTGIREEQTYLEAYVVENGKQFTIPELSKFEDLKLFYYKDSSSIDLKAGDKIQVNKNIDIYGYENFDNEPEEPVEPTPPVTPEEPEKPVEPTPPVTPEEPANPTPPTTPVKPTNPTIGGDKGMSEEAKKEVVQEIKDKPNGAKVTVDMKDANVVSKDVLEAAKGKDIVVELQFKGYTWSINGNDILATNLADINLEVSFDQNIIPNKVIKDLAKDNPIKQLSLSHNGDFGFKATLNVNVGNEYFGKYGNLYYYDSTGKLVYMNAGKIDEDGNVSLAFTHASEYVIVVNEQILGEAQNSSQNNTGPETGDASDIAMISFSMLVSCGCLLFVTMKKRSLK